MAEIKVAVRNTFILDVDEVLLRVTPRAPMAKIRKALRGEIKYLIGEMCDRVMSTPDFSETYFAHYLCRGGMRFCGIEPSSARPNRAEGAAANRERLPR